MPNDANLMNGSAYFLMVILCIFLLQVQQMPVQSKSYSGNKIKSTPNNDNQLINFKANDKLMILKNGVVDSNNSSSNLQNLLLFRMIMRAIKLSAGQRTNLNSTKVKIYGEGVEHKFPPFLERIIQRIQTYFSVYKYTDTSQTWQPETTTVIFQPRPPITPTVNLKSTTRMETMATNVTVEHHSISTEIIPIIQNSTTKVEKNPINQIALDYDYVESEHTTNSLNAAYDVSDADDNVVPTNSIPTN